MVVCPLEFERSMLERAGLDEVAELCCCGPGADNIKQWCLDQRDLTQPVILAGLAGALIGGLKAGTGHIVSRVVDETGESGWVPPLSGDLTEAAVIATSTRAPLSGRIGRKVVNRTSGAMVIDLESVAFAMAASKLGWRWGVVRGISDDLSTLLPENIDEWVGDDGQTNWKHVMRALLVRPTLIPVVMELRQHSQQAMQAIAPHIRSLLDRG